MTEVKIHKSINGLAEKWKQLEDTVSPFQTFEINNAVWQSRLFYYVRQKLTFVYAEVLDDGVTRLIAPLCKSSKGEYSSLSSINGLRNYDFVYSHFEAPEKIDYYTAALLDSLKGPVQFDCVREDSPIVRYAMSNQHISTVEQLEQGAIYFGNSYGEYHSSLSKNTRQNLRTAYNRMNTDNRKYSFEVFNGTPVPGKLIKELMSVYCKRRSEKYNNASFFHSMYLRYFDWQTREYENSGPFFTAVLKIDDKVAAFMSGFTDTNKGTVSIPRLAIDSCYGRYSPGILLLNETAKYFESNSDYQWLDLFGRSATYKLQMNAKPYYKYNVEIGKIT